MPQYRASNILETTPVTTNLERFLSHVQSIKQPYQYFKQACGEADILVFSVLSNAKLIDIIG